ncbi:enoyl-CoA hydratase/isomerase family protein [Pseudoalteromonas sp. McH1-7]|uniref:enoyl-CoA hydratase-related protein n=1 Tax=Pseudoalteromonas TaxID=53246 RepID=UPI000F646DCF|nr:MULTISPECIES: enoyl-CoA hydratase-related protein [Pseudoalteromonas]MDW7549874.1 enoyl-CoA hydratase-related protein [Pseudoalteromonas peptidolytica]NUZ09414.1 enoyl-CoA hydratase/isomerase family protein [Pseudoalteromonas sp. McH1-7]RRS06664.1 gamma-carboxygeranoyl-CoA hydratase [Pseudoalteromonas sp. J010]USD29791.1 enoyl-CoA hydratase/isomerase family protein [Pseudoalteromonas sp. SCSIO 43201]
MPVTLTITKNKVAILELSRPEKHNAFNAEVIAELIKNIDYASGLDVRALIFKTEGKHFSAGADLAWMKSMADNNYDENVADSLELAKLMQVLATCPHPTLCLVQGAAFGGALGLIACCDIAIAQHNSKFCLSEVKLGLIPAVISPYVIKAIGERQARRYFLTAEVFNAEKALEMGLIHELSDDLVKSESDFTQLLLNNGPAAVKNAKALINEVAGNEINEALITHTAKRIAEIRVSEEGQEGLSAFFDKRAPRWQNAAHE